MAVGLLVYDGWNLGTIQSVIFSCAIGMAVDFVAHLSHMYGHYLERGFPAFEAASKSTKIMAPSITMAALSTVTAGASSIVAIVAVVVAVVVVIVIITVVVVILTVVTIVAVAVAVAVTVTIAVTVTLTITTGTHRSKQVRSWQSGASLSSSTRTWGGAWVAGGA